MMTLMRTTTVVVAALVLSLAGPVNASWTPAELTPGPTAWYDASDASTIQTNAVAGKVSQWDDKSTNGYHVTQGTTSKQPATGVRTNNNLNILDFDGGDHLENLTLSQAQPDLIFVVCKLDANSGDANFFLEGATVATGQRQGMYRSSASQWGIFAGAEALGGTSDTNSHVFSALFNGVSSKIWVDGSIIVSANAGTGTLGGLSLGARGDGLVALNGAIGESLIITDTSDSTRQQIEGYLAWKWGLEGNLPIGHPYKDAAPGGSGATPGTLIYGK